MRLKHIKHSENLIYESSYVLKNPENFKSKYNSLFDNKNNNIELEIGFGKGQFLLSKAIDNPNINYIGIEKYPSVILNITKNLNNIKINNLKIICMDASLINEVFDKEISKLYLNFSDPWPKNRHEKRRLTSTNFLEKYDRIFKDKKIIELKTDNIALFEYSVETLTNYGYNIEYLSNDYKSVYKTEYEEKFIQKNMKINYARFIKD